MTYTTLPRLAQFIRKTHNSFARTHTDYVLSILGEMHKTMMDCPSIIGITFPAHTDEDHGDIFTEITITHLPEGGWQYEEHIANEQ